MSDADRLTDAISRTLTRAGYDGDPLTMARDRAQALECEVTRLRRERDEARAALRSLIVEGCDLARLVERARGSLADPDAALLAWADAVVSARGAMHGAER